MLFQADVRDVPVSQILEREAIRAAGEPERLASWLYARDIVDGVADHAEDIDDRIRNAAEGWTLKRMPNVDRALLRIATWEIVYNDEVPVAVAITEAIHLAQEYSTEDSSRFINGVLGAIADEIRSKQ